MKMDAKFMNFRTRLTGLSALILLNFAAACSHIPDNAYYNPGSPEEQFDASKESVSIPLTSQDSIGELSDWLNNDQPSFAYITCDGLSETCAQAERILNQYAVPIRSGGMPGAVELVYEDLEARDCHHSFVSNHINPYNLHHPSFGCSLRSNTIQMVSDRKQLMNPELTGEFEGEKAAQSVDLYRTPPERVNFKPLFETGN
jgi:hypothetical protein